MESLHRQASRFSFVVPGDRCSLLASRVRPSRQPAHQRRSLRPHAQTKDFYELLGVSKDVSRDGLKRAFKQKALKLHPDVNSAPDAAAQFAECKQAYETLANEDSRRRYDRGQGGGGWDPLGDIFGGGGAARSGRPKQPEEPWYGFGDFFRDLERDLDARKRRGGPPKSLWEEVNDLGEEFVEFLESGLEEGRNRERTREQEKERERAREERERGASGAGGSASSGARAEGGRRPAGPTAEELAAQARRVAEEAEKAGKEAAKRAEDEIEDMLQQLKQNRKK